MVDLVKIRKKSKDAKAAAADATEVQSPAEAVASPPAPFEPAPSVQPPTAAPVAAPQAPERNEQPQKAAVPPVAAEEPPVKPKKQAKAASGQAAQAPPAAEPGIEATVVGSAGEATASEVDEDRLSRFKRLAGKRRSWGVAARTSDVAEDESSAAELELLRFRVAGEDYAVDIDKIVEIVPPRATTRVPNAEESIVGIMSLRGTIVTVIDLRRKLGHPRVDLETLKDARMIVVERAGETAGFLVDRVSRVVKLDRSQLESHPVVSSAEQSEFVSGVFQAQDGLVILLDIERILAG